MRLPGEFMATPVRAASGDGRPSTQPEPQQVSLAPALAREALGAFPDGIALTDASGRVSWLNPALGELLELDPVQAAGCQISILAGPYAGESEGLSILEATRNGEGALDLVLTTAGGVSLPCLLRVVRLPSGERMVLVSEERERESLRAELTARAEIASRERALLRATADALSEGVIVLDDAERLVVANAAAMRVLECPQDSMRGRGLAELPLPGQVRGAWLTFLASRSPLATLTTRVEFEGRTRVLLMSLARSVSLEGVPLGSVLVTRDLSAETLPEKRRQDAVGQMTHELRTPLQSIQGFAQTLLGDTDLDASTRVEFARIIVEESRRLRGVVERLLTMLGRGLDADVVDRRRHDLALLVEAAVTRVRERRADAGPIDVEAPRAQTQAWVDAAAIGRVIEQVLDNAVLHGGSPAGARVSVRGSQDGVRIEVRDWGPGVPPQDLERIFDPFYRPCGSVVRETATGLGLPFCRHVVERHGGEIVADLPRGGGVKISISIPKD